MDLGPVDTVAPVIPVETNPLPPPVEPASAAPEAPTPQPAEAPLPPPHPAADRPKTVLIPGASVNLEDTSPRLKATLDALSTSLSDAGVPELRLTSGYRDPAHNQAVGGAKGSQHTHGNAVDIDLRGLTEDQKKATIKAVLANPNVGGVGFYKNGTIHVDVRSGARAAWGGDYTASTFEADAPGWAVPMVREWQGASASVAGLPLRDGLGAYRGWSPPPAIRDTIKEAADAFGLPAELGIKIAGAESGFNPNIQAQGSTALGLFQITDATWKNLVQKHGARFGLTADASRTDPRASALLGMAYVKETQDELAKTLGRSPSDAETYLGYFLGPAGAGKMLAADRNRSAAYIASPAALRANRAVFFKKDGTARTVGELIDFMGAKLDNTSGTAGVGKNSFGSFGGADFAAAPVTPSPEWSAAAAQIERSRKGIADMGFFRAVSEHFSDGPTGRLYSLATSPYHAPDLNYQPDMKALTAGLAEQFHGRFAYAMNAAHADEIRSKALAEQDVQMQLSQLGIGTNLVAGLVAGAIDPINIGVGIASGALPAQLARVGLLSATSHRVLAGAIGAAGNVATDVATARLAGDDLNPNQMFASAAVGMALGASFGNFKQVGQQVAALKAMASILKTAANPEAITQAILTRAAKAKFSGSLAPDITDADYAIGKFRARWSSGGQLATSYNAEARVAGAALGMDMVGRPGGVVLQQSADQTAFMLESRMMALWQASLQPAYFAWAKEQGISRAAAYTVSPRFREFTSLVSDAVEAADLAVFSAPVQQAATTFRQIMGEMADYQRNPGKLHGVADILVPDDSPVPRGVTSVVLGRPRTTPPLIPEGQRISVGQPDAPAWGKALSDTMNNLADRFGMARPTLYFYTAENRVNGLYTPSEHSIGVYAGSRASQEQALATMLHEFGHAHDAALFRRAPEATQSAIVDAWKRQIKAGGGETNASAGYWRPYSSMSFHGDDFKNASYMRKFTEWYAEQVSRYLTTQVEPEAAIERFFFNASRVWKAIYAKLTGKHDPLAPEVKSFIDGTWREQRMKRGDNGYHSVKGAEDLKRDPNYVPHVWAPAKVADAVNTHGEAAVVKLVAGSLVKGSGDVMDNALAVKIATAIVKDRRAYIHGDEGFLAKIAASTDPVALKELFKDSVAAITDDEAETLARLFGNKASDAGVAAHLKHRLRFDLNYADANGLRVKDMMERDANGLMQHYLRKSSGRVALAGTKIYSEDDGRVLFNGITSDAEFEVLKRRVQNSGQAAIDAGHMTPNQLRKDLDNLEFIYRRLVGRPSAADAAAGDVADWARVAQGVSYTQLMGNLGVNTLMDYGRAVGAVGPVSLLKQLSSVRRIVNADGNYILKHGLDREIEAMMGTAGAGRLTSFRSWSGEEAGAIRALERGRVVDKVQNVVDIGSHIVSEMSGANYIQHQVRLSTARAVAQRFADIALGKNVSKADLHMVRFSGLNDGMFARILAETRKHGTMETGAIFGRMLAALNMENWTDLEARSAFEFALFRYVRHVVQENDYGSLSRFMSNPMMRVFAQFKSYAMTAYENQLLHATGVRDTRQAAMIAWATLSSALVYSTLTHVQAIGRNDAEDFLHKRGMGANPDPLRWGFGVFQRAGYATVAPNVLGTVLLATPWAGSLDAFATNQRPSDLLFGNPTFGLLNATTDLSKKMTSVFARGEHLTQKDFRALTRLMPLQNHPIATPLLNSASSGLPEK